MLMQEKEIYTAEQGWLIIDKTLQKTYVEARWQK